jgi:hypothetical protein
MREPILLGELSAPEPADYRTRAWTPEQATHYQAYETISLGTPITPRFATSDELIDYLVKHGDFSSQQRCDGGWSRSSAENFVELGWIPDAFTEL